MVSSKKTKRGSTSRVFRDDGISLSPKLESWLKEIKVDPDKYIAELNLVFKNQKPRYYRIVDPGQSSQDQVVKWLRDVEVFVTNSNVPKYCYGIDASSAAVVDCLRLKRLVREEEVWILDMCCAPGGKLLATIKSIPTEDVDCRWSVIGLDSVKRRLDVCSSMLRKERYDRTKISVTLKCCRSQEFGDSMLGKFDRVILDVECTHEGSLRSVIRTCKYWGIESLEGKWNREYSRGITDNQKELLLRALKLIKPGGFVVYSTCSLDPAQNEILVSEVVRQFDNVRLYPLPLKSCSCCSYNSDLRADRWPAEPCSEVLTENFPREFFTQGLSSTCKNSDSPCAVRFNPLGGVTDGLFIALMVRTS